MNDMNSVLIQQRREAIMAEIRMNRLAQQAPPRVPRVYRIVGHSLIAAGHFLLRQTAASPEVQAAPR